MKEDGSLLEDTTATVRLLGEEALLVPFPQFTSAQRMSMSAQHIVHSLPPNSAEHPYIYTGYESVFGEYDFNSTKRDQDILILDIIPKYPENRGLHPLKSNPLITVVYVGMNDNSISYFNMEKYGNCTDGYGYRNNWMNTQLLQIGSMVPKEVPFCKSTSHIGDHGYGMGVNANVAFMTVPEVNNDAVMISDRLASKFTTTAVSSVNVDIDINQLPLNLYGDGSEHKFIPDIGEYVREDGIICGFRNPTDSTLVSDMLTLNIPYPPYDELYYAPPGAEIIDVEFYVGPSRGKIRTDALLFAQVDKYLIPRYEYWARVIKAYENAKAKYANSGIGGVNISPEFNTLVTKAMAMLMSSGKKVNGVNRRPDMKLTCGKEPIEFIRFKITYVYDRQLQVAYKLTDRVGTKGVVTSIRPLSEMPTDDFGYAADICVNPYAMPNRMSPSQVYEADINRISMFVQRQAIEVGNTQGPEACVEYVLDYIKELNPKYEELVCRDKLRRNPSSYLTYLESQEQKHELGIFLQIPGFLKHITHTKVLELRNKYNVQTTPVTFYTTGKNGQREPKRTKSNVSIGSKYMYVLYNIPLVKAPGVGHVNQFKIPVKPNPKSKCMSPIGLTPLRIGEDEGRIMTMCAGSGPVSRLMGIHANSFEAVTRTCETLLSCENPSKIQRIDISDEEIRRTNNVVGVAEHLMATMGIDMSNISCEAFDEVKFTADLGTRHPGQF